MMTELASPAPCAGAGGAGGAAGNGGVVEWGGGGSPSRSASRAAAATDTGAKAQALDEHAEGCTICAAPACVEPTRHDKCGNSFCRRCLLNWANAEFVRGRGLTCACASHSLGGRIRAPKRARARARACARMRARTRACARARTRACARKRACASLC